MRKQIAGLSILIINIIMCLAVAGCGSSGGGGGGGGGIVPGKVQNVNATDSDFSDKIVISWDYVEGATSYTVYYSDQEDEGYSEFNAVIKENYYEDTNIILDQIYYYKVSASNSAGTGEQSDSDTGNSHDGTPGIPENVSATDGRFDDKVEITWNAPESGASRYEVYRANEEDGAYTDISDGIITDIQFVDSLTHDEKGAVYYYKVRSITEQGESDFSEADSGYAEESTQGTCNSDDGDVVVPLEGPPINLAATTENISQLTVSWSAIVGDSITYKVYRSEEINATFTELAEVPQAEAVVTFIDETADAGIEYYYKVSAVTYGCSETKLTEDAVLGFIPEILPNPEGLTLSVVKKYGPLDPLHWFPDHGAEVSWTEVLGADSYLIQRSKNNGDNDWSDWEDVTTVTTSSELLYSDWPPKKNEHLRYRVKAFNEDSGIDGNFCNPVEIVIE